MTTAHRNKASLANLATVQDNDAKFADLDFMPDYSSLFWADIEDSKLKKLAELVQWYPAGSVFPEQSLFGEGISPDDV